MTNMKLIYIVLDGVADRPEDGKTSLELASKPGLDIIARRGIGGLMYTIGKGYAPESDSAVFAILSYNPEKFYTGRGPLEALGAGLKIREGYEVAFRGNFATIDEESGRIIDRRCGRDIRTDEARALANALDNMDLGVPGAYVKVRATVGHRLVVVIGHRSRKLSANVENTDPAYVRKGLISVSNPNYKPYIQECIPLDESEEAKFTAMLVNRFTKKAIEILSKHPINIKRASEGRLKANAILLRDAGNRLPKIRSLREKFNLRFGAVVQMPVERGIATLLGMSIVEVKPEVKDRVKEYENILEATLKLLKENDVVYVHLKGPDEPGHDRSVERKVKFIELIDELYVQPLIERLDLENVALLVTADHATPYTVGSHTDDPVPVIFYRPGITPDNLKAFTERECAKGSLGIIRHGWELLPRILKLLSK